MLHLREIDMTTFDFKMDYMISCRDSAECTGNPSSLLPARSQSSRLTYSIAIPLHEILITGPESLQCKMCGVDAVGNTVRTFTCVIEKATKILLMRT